MTTTRPPIGTPRRRARTVLTACAAATVLVLSALIAPTASAAVPESGRFALANPTSFLTALALPTEPSRAPQSFAFDPVTNDLYVAQTIKGLVGGVLITKYRGTQRLESMRLTNFGHASTLSVQHTAKGNVYLWTEGKSNAKGYGTETAQVRWKPGATVDAYARSGVQYFNPPRSDGRSTAGFAPRPVIDHSVSPARLVVRYDTRDSANRPVYGIVAYALNDVEGWKNRLVDVKVPRESPFGCKGAPQGFTAHGSHAYLLWAVVPGQVNGCPGPEGNVVLASFNLNTGKRAQAVKSSAFLNVPHREGEGLAVRNPRSSRPELMLGIAQGTNPHKRLNLARYSVLVK